MKTFDLFSATILTTLVSSKKYLIETETQYRKVRKLLENPYFPNGIYIFVKPTHKFAYIRYKFSREPHI